MTKINLEDITQREADVLGFIIRYKASHSRSPSVQEVMRGVNSKSASHIHGAIHKLIRFGYLRIISRRHRGILLTDKTKAMIA
jgi:SOS-response transcriptional repressor LexA